MLYHATLAAAATGLIGIGLGTGFGYVLNGVFGAGKFADLRDTIAAADAIICDLDANLKAARRDLGIANAEIVRLKPHAEAHRKTLENLAKGSAASAAKRAAKSHTAP